MFFYDSCGLRWYRSFQKKIHYPLPLVMHYFLQCRHFFIPRMNHHKRNQYIIYNRQQNLAYSTMNAIQIFEENYLSNNTVVLYVYFFFEKKKTA